MRRWLTVLAVTGIMLLLTVPLGAQEQRQGRGRGRGGPGGFGGPGLITNKSVQQELGMTEDQVKQADDAVKKVREAHRGDFDKLQGLEGQERFAKMQEVSKAVRHDTQKELAGILKPDQLKRLKEIELQQQGAQAFSDPDLQKELKLTDDQKEKIKTINEDARSEMRSIFQGAGQGGDRQEMMKKMQALRKETLENSLAVLTKDQQAKYKEMTGKPFQVKFEGRGGRRGRRGGAGQ